MVEIKFTVVFMKQPACGFDPVPINFEIQGNNYLDFIFSGATFTVDRNSAEFFLGVNLTIKNYF